MSDFQESVPSPSSSKAGGCIAIGCATVVAVPLLGAMLLNGGGGAIGFILVAAVVTLVIVQSRKKQDDPSLPSQPTIAASKLAERMATVAEASGADIRMPVSNSPNIKPSNSLAGLYTNPICNHRFSESALESEQVSCECGYVFNSADLIQYYKLNEQLETLQDRIAKLAAKIKSATSLSTVSTKDPVQAPRPVVQAAKAAPATAIAQPATPVVTAPPKPVEKPKPVRAARPKVNLSLQQWLIIGAAALVMVAASIFVGNGLREGWPPEAFAGVTVGLSIVMAFGAFRLKNISVTLVNFAATFSASMVTASLMILGDQISNKLPVNFDWNTAPAWWWAISMLLVSLTTTALARFSGNFAFKAIGVLTGSLSIGIYVVGHLLTAIQLPGELFGLYVATMSLAAVGILFQGKFLLEIKRDEVTDKAFKAYAKQLAEREDDALRKFILIAAGSLAAIGVGLAVVQASSAITEPGNPLGLLSVAAVWVALGLTSDKWSTLLSKKGKPAKFAKPLASGIVYVATLLSAISAATLIQDQVASSLLALALIGAATWFASKLGKLAPAEALVHIAMWFSAAIFAVWTLFRFDITSIAIYLLGISLLLVVRDLRFKSSLYQIPSIAVGSVGMLLLAQNIQSSVDVAGAGFAGLAVVFATATNLLVLLQAYIAKRTKNAFNEVGLLVALAFSAAIAFILHVQLLAVAGADLAAKTAFMAAFLAHAVATTLLATRLMLGRVGSIALNAQGLLGQAVVLLTAVTAIAADPRLQSQTASWCFASVAVLNYAFALVSKQLARLQAGFALFFIALFINFSTQAPSIASFNLQLGLIALVSLGHSLVTSKRLGDSKVLTVVSYSTLSAGLLVSYLLNVTSFSQATFTDLLSINLVLTALAVIAAVGAEVLGHRNKTTGTRLSVIAIGYASVSMVFNLVPHAIDDYTALRLRGLLTTVVFAAIVIRIFVRSKNLGLALAGYAANILSAVILGLLTQAAMVSGSAPEAFSVWVAASLTLTTWLLRKHITELKRVNLLDLPLVLIGLSSLGYALVLGFDKNDALLRGVVASLALAVFSYLRSARSNNWLIGGYLMGVSAALWLAQATHVWLNFTFAGPEGFTFLLALSVFLGNLVLVKRIKNVSAALRWGAIVAILALPSLFYSLNTDGTRVDNQIRQIASLLAITIFAQAMLRLYKGNFAWLAIAYLANSAVLVSVAHSSFNWFSYSFAGPEIYAAAVTAGILISHRLLREHIAGTSDHFKIGLPLAVFAVPSLIASFIPLASDIEQLLRRELALLVVSSYVFLMLRKHKQFAWAIASYLSVGSAMATLSALLQNVWPNLSTAQPEITSILVAAGLVASNRISASALPSNPLLFKWGVPVAVVTLPSLFFSLLQDQTLGETQLRRILSLAIISAFVLYVAKQSKNPFGWVVASYLTVAASMFSLVNAAYLTLNVQFDGPELYALAISAGTLLSQRLTKSSYEFKGSLFTWGLPLAILLVPSTLYTYASLQVPFGELTGLQVGRVVAVLLVSIALLVLGIRRGNLASTSIGLLGLAMVMIPGTAVHSNEVLPGAQIESTALVVGILIYVLLSVLHSRQILKGNSAVYLGIPVTIVLAPSLLTSLAALGNPTLGSVDWWRFGLVLAAGLTLLIVGSLRELAGMFYPGLVAVLLTALPYGFKQTQDQAWFLWVLLLLVAGVMVWVAVRLEQIKKAGRSSTAWLKELK